MEVELGYDNIHCHPRYLYPIPDQYQIFTGNAAFRYNKNKKTSMILEQDLRELKNSAFLFSEMSLGQGEQHL